MPWIPCIPCSPLVPTKVKLKSISSEEEKGLDPLELTFWTPNIQDSLASTSSAPVIENIKNFVASPFSCINTCPLIPPRLTSTFAILWRKLDTELPLSSLLDICNDVISICGSWAGLLNPNLHEPLFIGLIVGLPWTPSNV